MNLREHAMDISYFLPRFFSARVKLPARTVPDQRQPDPVRDLSQQDDTVADHFRIHVWYGPNSAQIKPGCC